MKKLITLKQFPFILILTTLFSCEDKNNLDTDDNLTNNTPYFYIKYDLGGKKYNYELDSAAAVAEQASFITNFGSYLTKQDFLNFGSMQFFDESYYFSPINGSGISPFGTTKFSFPKVYLQCQIPYFSSLKNTSSINNDTLTKNNKNKLFDVFVAHVIEFNKAYSGLNSDYNSYEAGVFSSPVDFAANFVRENRPTHNILAFNLKQKRNAKFGAIPILLVEGTLVGEMMKYNDSFSGNQMYHINKNKTKVKIDFKLPFLIN